MFLLQIETRYEEEREKIQQQLLLEQNDLLNKYREREVSCWLPTYTDPVTTDGSLMTLSKPKCVVWPRVLVRNL